MNLTIGQHIRHKRIGAVYRFIGYGMSHCGDWQKEWRKSAFYQAETGELFSQPIERFEERFEEVEE